MVVLNQGGSPYCNSFLFVVIVVGVLRPRPEKEADTLMIWPPASSLNSLNRLISFDPNCHFLWNQAVLSTSVTSTLVTGSSPAELHTSTAYIWSFYSLIDLLFRFLFSISVVQASVWECWVVEGSDRSSHQFSCRKYQGSSGESVSLPESLKDWMLNILLPSQSGNMNMFLHGREPSNLQISELPPCFWTLDEELTSSGVVSRLWRAQWTQRGFSHTGNHLLNWFQIRGQSCISFYSDAVPD